MEEQKHTPLLNEHKELGAQMAPFAGWLMPIQYAGILAETRWCREAASLFDTCHMGEFHFRGDFTATGLEEAFSCNVGTIPVGRARYGFLLNEAGGILDDLVIFRLADDEVMIVVNAGPGETDFNVIGSRLRGSFKFTDISSETGKLDLQGPLARAVLGDVGKVELAKLPFFGFRTFRMLDIDVLISRTGYTGELGYEIFVDSDCVTELWRRLSADERVRPAGLGARDVLRLEMGYSLYGSDIDDATTPLEARLDQFVDFGKEFIGRDALIAQGQQGLSRLKVAFRVNSRRTPRHDYKIYHHNELVGHVTSGVFSPMLGCGIGMGYVSPESTASGTALEIRHGETTMEAVVCDLPFYRDGSLKK